MRLSVVLERNANERFSGIGFNLAHVSSIIILFLSMGMVAMIYEVVKHVSPYKPIELRGRRRIITVDDVMNGVTKMPDAELYDYNMITKTWTLKP